MSGHYKYEVTYALPGPRLVKWLFFAVDDEAARCYAVEHGEREWPDGEVVELKCQGRWEPTTGVPALD